MSLQIHDADSDREKEGLERLQERIQGLALVHQKIYESENTNAVRIDVLIGEISENLLDGSARDKDSVTLTTDMDPVTVVPDKAVPLILFATEAIVNTFKHALSHVDDGTLHIRLENSDESLRLGIRNSIHGFARQLRGSVHRTQTEDSYHVELTVPKSDF